MPRIKPNVLASPFADREAYRQYLYQVYWKEQEPTEQVFAIAAKLKAKILDGWRSPPRETFVTTFDRLVEMAAKEKIEIDGEFSEILMAAVDYRIEQILGGFRVGDRVTHADIWHARGADAGTIVEIDNKELVVWWDSSGDKQIAKAFRSYEPQNLKLIGEPDRI